MSFDQIRQWAADRNLIEGATPQGQFVKLMEEAGELAAGIAKSRQEAVVDGIGDMVVVLTILAAQHGVTIEDCIATAYNEIKDRKGRMVEVKYRDGGVAGPFPALENVMLNNDIVAYRVITP